MNEVVFVICVIAIGAIVGFTIATDRPTKAPPVVRIEFDTLIIRGYYVK